MNETTLGTTGLRASRLGFGCSRLASLNTPDPPAEVEATLEAAYDAGVTFFDTADVYGQGDSERMLGRVFRARRDRVVLCTKVGLTLGVSQRAVRLAKPFLQPVLRRLQGAREGVVRMRQDAQRQCFEPAYLRRQVEGSLRRLRTDRVDVLLLHCPPRAVLERGEAVAALQDMVRDGLARVAGLSAAGTDDAAWALARGAAGCVEVEFSAAVPGAGDGILPAAARQGVGIICREVLGGGRLARADVRLSGGRTLAEAALRFALDRADAGVVLAGMTSRRILAANLAACAAAALTPAERSELASLAGASAGEPA